MKQKKFPARDIAFGLLGVLLCFVIWKEYFPSQKPGDDVNIDKATGADGKPVDAARVGEILHIPFDEPKVISEAGSDPESHDAYWWLNSGGLFIIENGSAHTLYGDLLDNPLLRDLEARDNPLDTDNGYHPQNIFRLVTRSRWDNFRQELKFKVLRDNLSSSNNRNESNGVLLFIRYHDSDNLYYAGVRVDGYAVIKKKIKGVYYTMADKFIATGKKYNRDTNPNLLPKNVPLGIRSEINDEANGSVHIKLFVDQGDGNWKLVLDTYDNGTRYGGAPHMGAAPGGIRTDFMDVEFDDYRVEAL